MSRKALRSPRGPGSEDPDDGWRGDAKVSGRAEQLSEDEIRKAFPEVERRMHSFRLDVSEIVVVGLDEPREHMVIESWHPGRGITTTKR